MPRPPQANAPEASAPQTSAPQGAAPEGTAPDGAAPEGTTPAPTPTPPAPGSTAPEIARAVNAYSIAPTLNEQILDGGAQGASGTLLLSSGPAPAVTGAPTQASRLPAVTTDETTVNGVLEIIAQRRNHEADVARAAQVLGTEKAAPVAPAPERLGIAAPLKDLDDAPHLDTVDLATRNGPQSASGDWNLLPEALYAVVPLLMAGAAVAAHQRNAAAAGSVAVVRRRRHASK